MKNKIVITLLLLVAISLVFVFYRKTTISENLNITPNKSNEAVFPYSISALSNRSYKPSAITIEEEVTANGNFKSFVVSFYSDSLKEYALMNIPNSPKPLNGYPVLILNHGYIKPSTYNTVSSYKSDSDYFANHGYLVLKPDYRGNGNSQVTDTSVMRFAYPIDVLNLMASIQNINKADKNTIFLWSHSMGGEVTLEVLEIAAMSRSNSFPIKAAAFWAPVTDPIKWFSKTHLPVLPEALVTPYPYSETFKVLGTPTSNKTLWNSLSPLNYLDAINVPILLQHGTADQTVPYEWSVELNDDLQKLNKKSKLISYSGDDHNLPLSWSKAVADDLDFYTQYVK